MRIAREGRSGHGDRRASHRPRAPHTWCSAKGCRASLSCALRATAFAFACQLRVFVPSILRPIRPPNARLLTPRRSPRHNTTRACRSERASPVCVIGAYACSRGGNESASVDPSPTSRNSRTAAREHHAARPSRAHVCAHVIITNIRLLPPTPPAGGGRQAVTTVSARAGRQQGGNCPKTHHRPASARYSWLARGTASPPPCDLLTWSSRLSADQWRRAASARPRFSRQCRATSSRTCAVRSPRRDHRALRSRARRPSGASALAVVRRRLFVVVVQRRSWADTPHASSASACRHELSLVVIADADDARRLLRQAHSVLFSRACPAGHA